VRYLFGQQYGQPYGGQGYFGQPLGLQAPVPNFFQMSSPFQMSSLLPQLPPLGGHQFMNLGTGAAPSFGGNSMQYQQPFAPYLPSSFTVGGYHPQLGLY
jgi:hypothetical protein